MSVVMEEDPLALEVHVAKGFVRVIKPVMGAGYAQFGFSAHLTPSKAWCAAIAAAKTRRNELRELNFQPDAAAPSAGGSAEAAAPS